MSSPMRRYVFVAPYRPIAGLILPMSKGEATWPATSVSLITGERDAVLIDAALTTQDAEQIVKWIEATGKNLTTIYITHGHGDHFFGLTTTFPGQIPAHPAVPGALDGDVIDLEGHQLRIILVAQADTVPSTIVHIPDLDAVIAGDVAYNGIHPWLAFTDHDILGATKTYIRDFERSLSGSYSAQALVDKMMARHGDLGNPYTLWTSAQTVIEQGQGASSSARR